MRPHRTVHGRCQLLLPTAHSINHLKSLIKISQLALISLTTKDSSCHLPLSQIWIPSWMGRLSAIIQASWKTWSHRSRSAHLLIRKVDLISHQIEASQIWSVGCQVSWYRSQPEDELSASRIKSASWVLESQVMSEQSLTMRRSSSLERWRHNALQISLVVSRSRRHSRPWNRSIWALMSQAFSNRCQRRWICHLKIVR